MILRIILICITILALYFQTNKQRHNNAILNKAGVTIGHHGVGFFT